ncbi:hypothetical protein [Acidisphaera sp. L21]|uniref:hypothetical protein n=1 Tax=Acidisphaera sp. L21 TaxID=1641851 RepID=UPI00131B05B5|nr:hypothetical protein [Acidisphaera sp. L21]
MIRGSWCGRFVAKVVAGDPKLRAILGIIRALSVPELDAWMQAGRRVAQGMSFAEAEAAMWLEWGREPPARAR